MNELVLIKIGGGLITDKSRPLTVREDMMQTAALGIQKAVEKFPEKLFVVGNGAGSFGHYAASQTSPSPAERIRAVHQSVVTLNELFTRALKATGLDAVTIVPADCITAQDGELIDFAIDPVENALLQKTIPVLFGDIVNDGTDKGMIFSTEMLLQILADTLHDRYTIDVLYVGEAPGVLDANGSVIPEISSESWKHMGNVIEAPKGYDVTGGMQHKVESALAIAKIAERVYIISGKDPQNISAALGGASVGTKIVA